MSDLSWPKSNPYYIIEASDPQVRSIKVVGNEFKWTANHGVGDYTGNRLTSRPIMAILAVVGVTGHVLNVNVLTVRRTVFACTAPDVDSVTATAG